MITYTTTTTAQVLATDGSVSLTSVTGITGPGVNKTTRTIIWIDREAMEVSATPVGLVVKVVRGVNGTLEKFHALGAQVWIGAEIDFTTFTGFEKPGLGLYSSLSRAFETTLVTNLIGTVAITEAQLLGGEIIGIPVAAANYTLPSATALLAAIESFMETAIIGTTFYFNILNLSLAADTITLVAGTGVTLNPASQTIVQNASNRFKVVFTNILTPAYTVYPG